MAHYRASESKREQFRRYLEKSGVLDTLTSILVALYEEPDKPNNALDFIKLHLGAAGPDPADVEALRTEISELQQKCEALTEENNELKNKLMQCEPAPEEKPAE
ncbi:C-Myc-binding protein isoform X2 [Cynoglossus semilaevis]|uniref:C-Myc-binding protein isoform X2 n=1 Tax=Cynoglossus semilaevis TaxID=244447 RepID=UPI00049647EA|nr:c-Myc-binding protein-like isoform X2 [Cynoglossus semilaevis]